MSFSLSILEDPNAQVIKAEAETTFDLFFADILAGEVTSDILTVRTCTILSERLKSVQRLIPECKISSPEAFDKGLVLSLASVSAIETGTTLTISATANEKVITYTVSGLSDPCHVLVLLPLRPLLRRA